MQGDYGSNIICLARVTQSQLVLVPYMASILFLVAEYDAWTT